MHTLMHTCMPIWTYTFMYGLHCFILLSTAHKDPSVAPSSSTLHTFLFLTVTILMSVREYAFVVLICIFLTQSSPFLKRTCFILFWRDIHISERETHNLCAATHDWHLYCHCIFVMKLRCSRCIHSLHIGKRNQCHVDTSVVTRSALRSDYELQE